MKVTFTPSSEIAELLYPAPSKAADFIPEWYSKIPAREPGYNGNQMARTFPGTSRTIKGCNPFLDTLTSGYIFELAVDVEFSMENGVMMPHIIGEHNLIGGTPNWQADGIPKLVEGREESFKWHPGWRINTPKGYSTLFTHPLNRTDLPFQTMSGIVETDTYGVDTNFPFQVRNPKNAEVVFVPKGTPICQAIPFKRDDWESKVLPRNDKEIAKNSFAISSDTQRSYRSKFWVRKTFK